LQGWIVSIRGPFPGSFNDAKIYRLSRISEYLEFINEYMCGDKGYQGFQTIVTPVKGRKKNLLKSELNFNSLISVVRNRVEHVFGKLKNFKILLNRYRGWGKNVYETHYN